MSVVCRDIVILEYRKAYNRKGMLWDDDITLQKTYEQNIQSVSAAIGEACKMTAQFSI